MIPDFNTIDIIVLVVLMLSCVLGVFRGFTREFFGVLSWLGALIAALYVLPFIRPYTMMYIKDAFFADVLGAFVVFVISLALLGMVTRVLSGKIKGSVLGGLDRSMGLLFGFSRAWLLFSLAYIAASFVVSPKDFPLEVKQARATPLIEKGSTFLSGLVPEESVKNFDVNLKPGSALKPTPPLQKVVALLSNPLPKAAEPSRKGRKTQQLSDVKGMG